MSRQVQSIADHPPGVISAPGAGPRPQSLAALPLRLVDLLLAGVTAVIGACLLAARQPRRRRSKPSDRPRLMAIDSMYSLEALRTRQAMRIVTHRDLEGYFERVWSVHPFVGADPFDRSGAGVGSVRVARLNAVHTMIEGRVGRFQRLSSLPYLNFVLAHVQLLLLLDRIVCQEGIGIVRGDPYYPGLLALLLGSLNRRPVELRVVANHDAIYHTVGALAYPRLFRFRAVERRVAHFTLSRADCVVTGSEDNRQFALSNGARGERVAYAGNWNMIDPVHLEEPREREALEDNFGVGQRPLVVCISRLERMKHPEDVIVSVAKARERDRRIAAVIVGDGSMRAELERLCMELEVEPDVVFAGARDQRWIARLLPRASAILAPYAGLALVEAALSAAPIIAYDYEWHSQLIKSDETGMLVPYRDTDAMAAAICALVNDPERAARLGAAARAKVLEKMRPSDVLAQERSVAARLLPLAGARGR